MYIYIFNAICWQFICGKVMPETYFLHCGSLVSYHPPPHRKNCVYGCTEGKSMTTHLLSTKELLNNKLWNSLYSSNLIGLCLGYHRIKKDVNCAFFYPWDAIPFCQYSISLVLLIRSLGLLLLSWSLVLALFGASLSINLACCFFLSFCSDCRYWQFLSLFFAFSSPILKLVYSLGK